MLRLSPAPWAFTQEEKFPYRLYIRDAAGCNVVYANACAHSTKAKTFAEHMAGVGFQGEQREQVVEALQGQIDDFRLMSKAPQILEALQESLPYLERFCEKAGGTAIETRDKVRALIAEARGEA